MKKNVLNTALLLIPSATTGLLCGISIALTSHKNNDPSTETVTLTFDAGQGVISGTSQSTIDLEFNKKITWEDISDKPSAFLESYYFAGWTLEEGSQIPVPDTYLFNSDETLYAIYTDCEHEFDSYSIEEIPRDDGTIIRRIWGHCSKCGEDIRLNDDSLKKLAGKVLVKDGNSYILKDSLPLAVAEASSSVDIYLIYGKYEIYGERIGSIVEVNLHGVHDSSDNMVSTLDDYNYDIEGVEKIWYAIGYEIYCDNMMLEGKDDADITWQGGILCNHIQCEYCLIKGARATYCDTCTFLNCDFDSTNVVGVSGTDSDYSVFLYNRYATFHNCHFKSIGKAIKIYSHGAVQNNSYEFVDCDFTITEHVEPKPAINVDSIYQSETRYQVYVSNCKLISGYDTEPLYADSANPSNTDFYPRPRPKIKTSFY